MICKPCRWEADGVKGGRFTHDEVAVWNENRRRGQRLFGHADCQACDCKHHDVETT